VRELDRRRVRRCFEVRFTAMHMADAYVQAYERVIDARRPDRERLPLPVAAAVPKMPLQLPPVEPIALPLQQRGS
jgi:hypothetical protein